MCPRLVPRTWVDMLRTNMPNFRDWDVICASGVETLASLFMYMCHPSKELRNQDVGAFHRSSHFFLSISCYCISLGFSA